MQIKHLAGHWNREVSWTVSANLLESLRLWWSPGKPHLSCRCICVGGIGTGPKVSPSSVRGSPQRLSLIWEKIGCFIRRGACMSVSGGSTAPVTGNGRALQEDADAIRSPPSDSHRLSGLRRSLREHLVTCLTKRTSFYFCLAGSIARAPAWTPAGTTLPLSCMT